MDQKVSMVKRPVAGKESLQAEVEILKSCRLYYRTNVTFLSLTMQK